MYSAGLAGALCLVLGGEKRGAYRAPLGQAAVLVQIPYGRAFARSPGPTAAAATLAFEVMRQRRHPQRRPEPRRGASGDRGTSGTSSASVQPATAYSRSAPQSRQRMWPCRSTQYSSSGPIGAPQARQTSDMALLQ
jgi:hypothetical protein